MSTRSLRYVVVGISIIILFVIIVLLVQQSPGSAPPRSLKVAVVTDALFSDRGWGGAALNASRFIETKYRAEMVAVDNVAIADIESTLTEYASQDYDLIIAHGFQWGDPALRVGTQFPEVKIVVFTGLVKSDNVASIFPMQQEGSFLLGALAAMMTKTDVIGYLGGEEYPNVVNIFEGYKQGAKTINPRIEILGTYLNDWDNPAKAKEAATSIIRREADVLFHVADTSGHGVIEAARQNHVYALGAVQDQNFLAPDTVLSSFVLDVNKAYDYAVQIVLNRTFTGKIFKPGIERVEGDRGDGIVYLAPFHDLDDKIPAPVKERLQKLTDDVLSKRISVPERYEESS